MLLTSGQVSFAISSVIVFLFTLALFLSGYALQQQTLRDLRAAIQPQLVRPPPGPELYLPPRFREDGYLVDSIVVTGEDGSRKVGLKAREENKEGDDDMVGATRWQKAARKKKIMEAQKGQKPVADTDSDEASMESTDKTEEGKTISRAERRRKIKEQILAEGEGEGFKGYRRRMW